MIHWVLQNFFKCWLTRQCKPFTTFCPFPLLNTWHLAELVDGIWCVLQRAMWWNTMQNLAQNLNWNIAICLDTHCLMWFFFPWRKLLGEAERSKRMEYCRKVAQTCINIFLIGIHEQFWCLESYKISSNVTFPLVASRYLLTHTNTFFLQSSENEGGKRDKLNVWTIM